MSDGNIPDGDEPGYAQGPGFAQGPSFGQGPSYGQGPSFGQPGGAPPPNYMVWAILTTLLCCLPAGIVSIVFASQVNRKWRMGDYQGAIVSSNRARIWAITSAVVAVIGFIIIMAVNLRAGH
jgi:hypothetical protein